MPEDADRGSCCALLGLRWRAKQELSRGEPFNEVHSSTADRTVPWATEAGRRGAMPVKQFMFSEPWSSWKQERQEDGARLPVGEIRSWDAHQKHAWQQMKQG